MPAARKPAAKSAPRKVPRAEAQKAIADMKDKPREGEFRGITFTLPAKLPASFVFDAGEMAASDGTDFAALHRLMVGIVGDKGWRAIRDKIAADGNGLDDVPDLVTELFDAIMRPYGMSPGESGASSN